MPDSGKTAHIVLLEPSTYHVQVRFNGKIVADSQRPVIVQETGLPDVYYIPEEDVRREFLTKTDHQTYCPYKGHASYYTLTVGERSAENAVWCYPSPMVSVEGLKGLVSFYASKVDGIDVVG